VTEWNASEYDRLSALQATMAEEVSRRCSSSREANAFSTSAAAMGKPTAEIAARVPQGSVTGVDASADMIASRKITGPQPIPTFNSRLPMPRHLPFQQEFDLIVSFNALHWITDQALPLQGDPWCPQTKRHRAMRLVPKDQRKSIEDVIEETRLSERWAAISKVFNDPYLHLTPQQYADWQGARLSRGRPAYSRQGLGLSIPAPPSRRSAK